MMPTKIPVQILIGAVVFAGVNFSDCVTLQAMPPAGAGETGIVFVVEGVGGFDLLGATAQHALPKAGVPHEIRDFVWTHGRGKVFKDLQDIRYLLRKAGELA